MKRKIKTEDQKLKMINNVYNTLKYLENKTFKYSINGENYIKFFDDKVINRVLQYSKYYDVYVEHKKDNTFDYVVFFREDIKEYFEFRIFNYK